MSRVEIKSGGKMQDFKKGGRLSSMRFTPSETNSKTVQMYLETSEGQDNITYLTLDEAVELKAELDKAISESIKNYHKE
jgi:hypothetical protein